MQVREVLTGSNSTAVQIIYYKNRKRVIFKHVGSGRTDLEVLALKAEAEAIIKQHSNQLNLFDVSSNSNVAFISHCECVGIAYNWLYNCLNSLQREIGFIGHDSSSIINDLVTMRIVEPASKLRSIELIEQYFGIKHRRQRFYESALSWLPLKNNIEASVVKFAQQAYSFDFELLFYDVTTLYFETFQDDELRKTGFSKDNKSQQPQIVVALMVSREGFPISYEIFSGDTFEGHTFIPVIKAFIDKHDVKALTIVADAAMISDDNVKELQKVGLKYIVGGRLGNISKELFDKLDKQLTRHDGNIIRLNTEKGSLICSYSEKRYKKDKFEMEKQIDRAKKTLTTPSKSKKVKFLKSTDEKLQINEALIEKTKKLLGIKGYYTNLEETSVSNSTVIERYHDLYRIEQAFRIAKSDLKTRPIFHFKEEPIKLHMLIAFMALVISKHIELKTKVSIKKFITEAKKITDVKMVDHSTNNTFIVKGKVTALVNSYMSLLGLPH